MRLRLLVSEAWRSLGANLSTTFAAMMTVLIGMFLLGLLIALGTLTLSWSNHVKHEISMRVEFKMTSDKGGQATKAQENAVARSLQGNPLVGSLKFIPKSVALAQMRKTQPQLVNAVPWNPFPDVIEVTPTRGEDVGKLYASLHPLAPGVQKVMHDTRDSNRILRFAHWVELIFLIAVAILLTSASLLIANTIRLSIFSRRREIEVMKLVGATNWFVRGPFMIEGLLCGLGGAALAVLLLLIGKEVAVPAILHSALSTPPDVHALAFPFTALAIMGIGLALGAVGSGLTVRRFLKV
ncbi:MAG TPA: permease-like cell division protein FtsX [Gaiellaceae bacterium]|jgi:cell division transport system permease protein|nr:permease-like cell division protein FtsX [Gaiellaceae bacterium]